MRIAPLTAIVFCTVIICSSCDKENNADTDCFSTETTTRQIVNAQAVIKEAGGQFYIVEKSAVDTKLNPCTLEKEFRVNNLEVTISGEVKQPAAGTAGLCCVDNFVITGISK